MKELFTQVFMDCFETRKTILTSEPVLTYHGFENHLN